MLCKVNSNSNHYLFRELLSASNRVRHVYRGQSSSILEFARRRSFQFAGCFLPANVRMWNELPYIYTVFDTGTYVGRV